MYPVSHIWSTCEFVVVDAIYIYKREEKVAILGLKGKYGKRTFTEFHTLVLILLSVKA